MTFQSPRYKYLFPIPQLSPPGGDPPWHAVALFPSPATSPLHPWRSSSPHSGGDILPPTLSPWRQSPPPRGARWHCSPPPAGFTPPRTSSSIPVIFGASSSAGQYFVILHIGTPPQRSRLVADTGSDLVWARCSPCCGPGCSARHPSGSAFLPHLFVSPFHCYDPSYGLVPHPRHSPHCPRSRLHSPYRFRYSYADRSSVTGFFSHETATLNTNSGHLAHLPTLPFGCAFNVSSGPSLGAEGKKLLSMLWVQPRAEAN